MAIHKADSSSQLSLLGAYENKYSECLKLLLEDCQQEMLKLFNMECGNCLLLEKCSREWACHVCNRRDEIKPEEFVNVVYRFLKIKEEARIQFRYKRVMCLRSVLS